MPANVIAAVLLLASSLIAQSLAVQVQPITTTVDARSLSVGDWNGDGRPDLVVAGWHGVSLIPGDGLGGFGAAVTLPSLFSHQAHLADGGGDGKVDLWFNELFGQRLMLGDGAGHFVSGPSPGSSNGTFAVADIDGDLAPDLVAEEGTTSVTVARNDGSGNFGPPQTIVSATQIFSFGPFAFGDVNSDGHVDVLSHGLTRLWILLGNGAGQFQVQPQWPVTTSGPLAIGDLDGDRVPDLVLGQEIWINDGLGSFALRQVLVGPPVNQSVVIDIDADGAADLVGTTSDSVVVFPGDGAGNFGSAVPTFTGQIRGLATGDFDCDGRPDVLTVEASGQSLLVLRSLLPIPQGIVPYGAGTPTCRGTMTMSGSTAPRIGASNFRILCANAPANASGVLAIGTRVTNGWEPLGLGLRLHLGIGLPLGAIHSDAGGAGSVRLPLPALPSFAGLTVHVQSFWMAEAGLGDTCSPALYELASSRGLSITLQP